MGKAPELTRLYPTGTHYIAGVAAVECDVSPERAAELLAYSPPAFTTNPPPDVPVTEGPPDGGSSDPQEA